MAEAAILYGPDGQPIKRDVLKVEIAGPSITGVRSPLTGYPGNGLNPNRLAAIMREADHGEPLRYFELAEQIEERDLHYTGVLGTRRRSVTQLDITVEAADDQDAAYKQHADMIEEWLRRDELQFELFDILDAIGKGVSFTEIIWDSSEGQHQPRKLEWRDPRWFRFSRVDGRTPLLRTDSGDVELPPFKFIRAEIRAKSGLPVRSGLARLATWSWMFKAFTLRDWAIFTQTYGQPIRVGKYPAGATEDDKDTLFMAVANIAGDCAAIVPQSMNIEFIESKNVGPGSDLYEKRATWLDQQVSKAVLGQTSTSDAVTGGLGSGDVHREVQEDIERADAKALAAVLNRDLVVPWVQLNFGPQRKYPRLHIGRPEERNVSQTVDGVTKLVPFGLRVGRTYFNDLLGVPVPKDDEDILVAQQPTPLFGPPPAGLTAAPALHAQQRNEDQVDRIAREALQLASGANDEMIDAIRNVVTQAKSLADLRDRIVKLDLPKDKLAAALRAALVIANMVGRADIADEAGAAS